MGQLFFMGWEGTEVTPQIRTLIEDHHLGAILLTTKNLKSILIFFCVVSGGFLAVAVRLDMRDIQVTFWGLNLVFGSNLSDSLFALFTISEY